MMTNFAKISVCIILTLFIVVMEGCVPMPEFDTQIIREPVEDDSLPALPDEKTSSAEKAPREEIVLAPPPAPEDLIFLPKPRSILYEPNQYADAMLAPVETIDPATMTHPQGYVLSIAPHAIQLIGGSDSGLFYGRQTLAQLLHQCAGTGKLPAVHIEDWPDFPNRGAMLDVARDKVPTLETLFMYVDMFAAMKFNQLQLYTEHTFAYPGHETVWENASPLTGEDIRALDAYCRKRFIELVPNQNSFGHMHRWLQHDAYQSLAETPSGSDLCPVHPGSIALLENMYDSLLPNFSSGQFNVGCDETFSLGKGGSKAEVERIGKGRVYLNFLTQIHALVRKHDKVMQFWGDIILEYPELIPELPDHIIAMEWGYEANHPFAKRGRQFAASGIPFYVCPGTSSWNSLLGRTENALENLRLAAQNGLENGAVGYLVTDWGDSGHWQFAPVSFVPFAYGAAVSWAFDANASIDLARAADVHVFQDRAGVMAQAAMNLGQAHALTGVIRGNNTVYYGLLMHALQGNPNQGFLAGLSPDGIVRARTQIESALETLAASQMDRNDAELILNEFTVNARMALFALQMGEERIRAGGMGTAQLSDSVRRQLAEELSALIANYKDLWLARNRQGGLSDSAARLENILDLLTR